MTDILLIEDDKNLAESLSRYLVNDGYKVRVASSLEAADSELKDPPRLVILDWMLPDGQGIDLLRRMRHREIGIPVILLTARTELVDKILGLETGANDYITKPFEPRELVARTRVQLREKPASNPASPSSPPLLTFEGIQIDPSSREVRYKDRKVETTRMEYGLLKLFVENPNRVFSREELLNRAWGYEIFPTTRTVDTHILQLRQKLDERLFETVRGIGYRLRSIRDLH